MQLLYSLLTQLYYSILSCFYQEELNVVVLGFPNSGKSTLVDLLTGENFHTDMIPTIGVDFKYHRINNLILKIFDVSGQERFQSTLWKESCKKNADLIIYVIDLSDPLTLENSKQKAIEILLSTNRRNTPMVIVGNKSDLLKDSDFVTLCEDSSQMLNNDGNNNNNNNNNNKIANGTNSSNTPQINRTDAFMSFLGLKQETSDKIVLKRKLQSSMGMQPQQLPLQTDNEIASSKKNNNNINNNNKQADIEHQEEEFIEFYRDIGVFIVSCKEGEQIDDLINWVIER